ncbi:MAG: EAL domain-containing protein [Actinomycetota bacterium]|nr:EAL domain-containing protein [Actinomycetota bacterium]
MSVTLTRTGALSPVLPELVRDLLARSEVTPSRCWLGIPEAAVAHDLEAASRVVIALDELGVGVALRDFGAAVSSLERLRHLPAPTMTIAGPLVAAVRDAGEPNDAGTALLAAIVEYAHALGASSSPSVYTMRPTTDAERGRLRFRQRAGLRTADPPRVCRGVLGASALTGRR